MNFLSSYLQRFFTSTELNISFGTCRYFLCFYMKDVILKQFNLLSFAGYMLFSVVTFFVSLYVCRKKCVLVLLSHYVWMGFFFPFHLLRIHCLNQFSSVFSQHVNETKTLNCFSIISTSPFLSQWVCFSLRNWSSVFSFLLH